MLSLSGNPKHLAQTLGITLQAQDDYGDLLYSLIYKGGVIQRQWVITTNGGLILRELLRSCLHVYVCGWRVGGVGDG